LIVEAAPIDGRLRLMELHLDCLYTRDADGRTLFVNEPDNKTVPAACFCLGRTSEGNTWRFHADVPNDLVARLEVLCVDEPPPGDDVTAPAEHTVSYLDILRSHFTIHAVSGGPVYAWANGEREIAALPNGVQIAKLGPGDEELLRTGFPDLVDELAAWQPYIALLKRSRITREPMVVSICRSARITSDAHEAGVETHTEHRGKGYAAVVADAWANEVRKLGAIPLYSTSSDNTASQAVARKLGLQFVGSDLGMG
jgi:hypothetical protein